MSRSWRPISLSLLAGALIGLFSSTIALASIDDGAYTLVNPTQELIDPAVTEFAGGFVSCPGGQRVVAEGAFWHPGFGPYPSNAASSHMGSNTPTSDGLGMFSAGRTETTAKFRQTVMFCLPASVIGANYETESQDLGPLNNGSTGNYVPCPAGHRIVSGGAFWHLPNQPPTAQDAEAWISSSTPTEDGGGWYADGANNTATPRVLTIIAHCLPSASVGGYSIHAQDLPASNAIAGGYLPCPDGQRIVTGGAFWHEPGQGPNVADAGASPLSSSTPMPDARGWYADGRTFVANRRLRAVAACVVPRTSQGTTPIVTPAATATPAATTGQRAAALARCKKKKGKTRKKCRKKALKLPV